MANEGTPNQPITGGPMPDGPPTSELRRRRRYPHGLVWGGLIVVVGLVFLLDQLGVVSADHLFRFFWPAIFLYFGLEGVLTGCGPGKFWGTMLTLAGFLLLLDAVGWVHVTFAVIWPLLIIFWGVSILLQTTGLGPNWRGQRRANWFGQNAGGSTESELDYTLIFSGVKRRITSKDFRGGRIVAVFGGFNLDLRKADIQGEEVEIHTDAIFGGGEIRVPETWRVSVRGAAVLGAFVDETRAPYEQEPNIKRLVLTGSAVFGGVNVKN
jgi:predicted membrane protein